MSITVNTGYYYFPLGGLLCYLGLGFGTDSHGLVNIADLIEWTHPSMSDNQTRGRPKKDWTGWIVLRDLHLPANFKLQNHNWQRSRRRELVT